MFWAIVAMAAIFALGYLYTFYKFTSLLDRIDKAVEEVLDKRDRFIRA